MPDLDAELAAAALVASLVNAGGAVFCLMCLVAGVLPLLMLLYFVVNIVAGALNFADWACPDE